MSFGAAKCGANLPPADATACSKCGLAVARMATFSKERDEAVPDVLTKAWERALEAWEDIERHDEVIRLVSQNDAFAWAAARYRTRSDEIGVRQLDRVRKAAELTMKTSATTRVASTPAPYRAAKLMLILLVVVVGAALVYAMVKSSGPTATPPIITPSKN